MQARFPIASVRGAVAAAAALALPALAPTGAAAMTLTFNGTIHSPQVVAGATDVIGVLTFDESWDPVTYFNGGTQAMYPFATSLSLDIITTSGFQTATGTSTMYMSDDIGMDGLSFSVLDGYMLSGPLSSFSFEIMANADAVSGFSLSQLGGKTEATFGSGVPFIMASMSGFSWSTFQTETDQITITNFVISDSQLTASTVPLPPAAALLAAGLGGLAALRRRS